MIRQRREGERGFALLMVFLMAAVVALYLYTQLPRVAFESERDKEQTLIDHGEQFKRGIQLYVIATKKYPQKIEDLENTNEKRYLRQRYIDPMTGKNEWRLIHVNAGGMLIDSLVQKPPNAVGPDGKPVPADGALSNTTSTTGTNPATNQAATAPDANDVNAAVRRRPSDVVGQAYTSPANADPNDPSTWAPITLAPTSPTGTNGQPPTGAVGFNGGLQGQQAGQVGVPGQPGFRPGVPGVPGQPGQVPIGGIPLPGQPGFNPNQNQFKVDPNGQLVPITNSPTAQTGQGNNLQTSGAPNGGQNMPVMPFNPQNPAGGNQQAPGGLPAQNSATNAINNMLTNPNPAGAGLGNSAGMTQGGIAGVASTFKGPSIKIYGTRQKYQEWEFIFSLNNGQPGPAGQARNPLGGAQNGTNGANGTQGANGTATPSGNGTTAAPSSPPPGN